MQDIHVVAATPHAPFRVQEIKAGAFQASAAHRHGALRFPGEKLEEVILLPVEF